MLAERFFAPPVGAQENYNAGLRVSVCECELHFF